MKQAIALLFLISTTAVAQPKPPPKDPPKQDVPPDPYGDTAPAPSARSHFDLSAVQGLLAVQRLDGWLLSDDGAQNPIARQLVNPDGAPARRWFYLIPANGDPIALVHTSEMNDFARTPGKHIAYTGYKDLEKGLRAILKGKKTIAMEYSPKGALPSIARTDAGTLELVRGLGVTVRGSEGLVAFTKALWGPEGRKAHYVAEHHLTELRKEALAYAAKQVAAGAAITEYDLQQRIVHGMQMRGLVGPPPVVAAGANTADPYYVPSKERAAPIKQGDLLVVSFAGRVADDGGIYAETTWVAYVGDVVPEKYAKAFDVVALARDEAITLIKTRLEHHRAIKGSEVDDAARAFVTKAGWADQFVHRTGHSIDSDLQGGGADLDDYEVKDTRNLVQGSGFTIAPGVYFPGEFGLRAEVCAFLGTQGLEVTSTPQDQIEALLPKSPPAKP
ncbi:MAG TPA: M24 family metallopeptidase [Kofleriaceae bacterium]|nr:M24 family metallopeptidase [Kofleriaceae bacterium]